MNLVTNNVCQVYFELACTHLKLDGAAMTFHDQDLGIVIHLYLGYNTVSLLSYTFFFTIKT